MKKRLLRTTFGLIAALATSETVAHARINDLETLRAALAAVEQAGGDYVDTAPQLLTEVPAFVELQKDISSIWSPALERLDYVAPTETQKSLFILSLEALPADDYVSAVERLLELTKAGRLKPKSLSDALAPRGKLDGLFIYNYDHPRVKDLLLRARAVLPPSDGMTRAIDSILTGEAKKGHSVMRSASAYAAERPGQPPRLSSAPPTAGPSTTPRNRTAPGDSLANSSQSASNGGTVASASSDGPHEERSWSVAVWTAIALGVIALATFVWRKYRAEASDR